MESNKILAALLTAGIIAMLAGFMAKLSYGPAHHGKETKHAYEIAADMPADAGASAAPAVAEPVDGLMAAADIAQGEKLSKVCGSCHTFDAGGANRVGPNLHGIVGANHAHSASFAYSDAMKAKSGSKWDVASLNEFLWSPQKTIPGTKMSFAGLKKPEDRAALIKWLATQK